MDYREKLEEIVACGESFAEDGGDFREVLSGAFGDRIECDAKTIIATNENNVNFAIWRHKKGFLVASLVVRGDVKADIALGEHLSAQVERILAEAA